MCYHPIAFLALVCDANLIEIFLVFSIVKGLENRLEFVVIAVEATVAVAQVQGHLTLDSRLETMMSKIRNILIRIGHGHDHSRTIDFINHVLR